MTWSISASGLRKDTNAKVQQEIDRQVGLGYMLPEHGEAVKACVAAIAGDKVSVNASGHTDLKGLSGFSVSVSAYFVPENVVGTSSVAVGGMR